MTETTHGWTYPATSYTSGWRQAIQDLADAANADYQIHGYQWANAAARTAQTGMVEGDIGYQADTNTYYQYSGSAWGSLVSALRVGDVRIIPSAATNGTVSAAGVVTSTAQTLVRVRDAFPTDYTVFRIVFDITTSAAASLAVRLAVDATDAATAYDEQRVTFVSTTAATVQALNAAQTYPGAIGVAGARHFGEMLITDPNVAGPTYATTQAVVAVPGAMTAATGAEMGNFLHRTSTAYNSINFYPGSGNVTVNRLTVYGVS